jgi:hypothetical protein
MKNLCFCGFVTVERCSILLFIDYLGFSNRKSLKYAFNDSLNAANLTKLLHIIKYIVKKVHVLCYN